MTHEAIAFTSEGVTCRGRLLHPPGAGEQPRPIIVMAHGFGATIEAKLQPYAERFVADGHRVLLFDYRHFGGSDGMPRHVVSPWAQLRDWDAAIAFARNRPDVDPDRIGLWGTSFSGGHVVAVAAMDRRVAAVISQAPMMDGAAAVIEVIRYGGIGHALRMIGHGLRDLGHAAVHASAHMVPIVDAPGELGVMTTEDAVTGYWALVPPDHRNEVAARIAVTIAAYRPGRFASRIPCPILIQICERDTVAPVEAAERAGRRAGAWARIERYPIGHFDIYFGDAFERSVADQRAFFAEHLTRAAT